MTFNQLLHLIQDDTINIIDRNTEVLVYCHHLIQQQDFKNLQSFLNYSQLHQLHPSLIKSLLVITKGVAEVEHDRQSTEQVLEKLREQYPQKTQPNIKGGKD